MMRLISPAGIATELPEEAVAGAFLLGYTMANASPNSGEENTVRMMSPDGILCDIPEDQVQAATEAGARVMTKQDLAAMFNRIFMDHVLFKENEKKLMAKFQKRRSLSRRR